MYYKGGRGVVPPAGVCPGKMIVKFRGWPRGMDMCRCVCDRTANKKRLAEFQQVFKFVLGTGIEPILQD